MPTVLDYLDGIWTTEDLASLIFLNPCCLVFDTINQTMHLRIPKQKCFHLENKKKFESFLCALQYDTYLHQNTCCLTGLSVKLFLQGVMFIWPHALSTFYLIIRINITFSEQQVNVDIRFQMDKISSLLSGP
jgi:hypothetical protein